MATITIRFIGLCIHLEKSAAPDIPRSHRVVLLANPLPVPLFGHQLAPHVPKLKLPYPMDIRAAGIIPIGSTLYQLDGVSLLVAGPDGEVHKDDTWRHVPHLKPPDEPLELDEGVAYAMVPPAAAYFEIGSGTLQACYATGANAIGTTLTVTTEGPPVLEIVSLNPVAKHCFEFRDGDRIVITNVAEGEGQPPNQDDEYDYLLNYGLATELPQNPQKPRKVELADFPKCIEPDIDGNLGPSCSNSNFP